MTAAKLHSFEGRDIDRTAIKIVGAGDGLSEALAIAPDEIELDDERYYVLRGACSRVSMETDKHGATIRVHTIKTQGISSIEPELAEKVLQDNADKLTRAKAEMDGQLALDAENEALAKEALD